MIIEDLQPLGSHHPHIRITCPLNYLRPKAVLGTILVQPALPKLRKPSSLCWTGEHFKGTQYPVRRGIVAQSSGKKHGHTESLPYVDTVCIHEGRVCLPGKHGESKLVRSPVRVFGHVCVDVGAGCKAAQVSTCIEKLWFHTYNLCL